MDSIALVAGLVGLILIGAPVALAMLMLPTIYVLLTDAAPMLTIPHQMYEAVAKLPLVAIPFFMLTGELMNSSTVTDRILDLSRRIVGRMRGGLAQVNVVSSMFFAGMNGSAVADTATIGTILIPAMKRAGYPAAYAAGLTAVASTIGGIIPPSIAMIILASTANLSVGAMFAAGIVPGILIGLALMAVTWLLAVRRGYERSTERFDLRAFAWAALRASGALTLPVVLVGGILGGWFSSVESGAITAVLAVIIGRVVYRSLSLSDLVGAVGRTVRLTASVFIVIAAAGPFGWLLAKVGTIVAIEQWLLSFAASPVLFVFAVLLVILAIGTFLDAPANIVLFGPVLISSSVAAGFSPVTAALAVVIGFLVGMVTPPVGACWFLASRIAESPLEESAVQMLPYLAVEILVLAALFVLPFLTLAIPDALGLL
ncbi:MAG: TRAP transporter large permease [Lautropia sp.]